MIHDYHYIIIIITLLNCVQSVIFLAETTNINIIIIIAFSVIFCWQVSAPQSAVGRRGHSLTVFSLGPRHFVLVIYGGISEWLVDKSHRDQPIVTETAVVELSEFIIVVTVICSNCASRNEHFNNVFVTFLLN